ncbi:MAG: hypothetical protein IKO41_13465 [Lachnospiraceae bacterium]|nr:hypothetical protein [Lachnospiraceae bacterium]
MKIRWSLYKWAPETFRVSVDGKVLRLEDPSRFGCLAISGKRKELEDEIKRIVRKAWRKPRLLTIAFRGASNPDRYFYTTQLTARADDFDDRLRVFKEWKRYCLEKGCVLTTPISVTEGEFVPGAPCKGSVKFVEETVDVKKPLTVWIR